MKNWKALHLRANKAHVRASREEFSSRFFLIQKGLFLCTSIISNRCTFFFSFFSLFSSISKSILRYTEYISIYFSFCSLFSLFFYHTEEGRGKEEIEKLNVYFLYVCDAKLLRSPFQKLPKRYCIENLFMI